MFNTRSVPPHRSCRMAGAGHEGRGVLPPLPLGSSTTRSLSIRVHLNKRFTGFTKAAASTGMKQVTSVPRLAVMLAVQTAEVLSRGLDIDATRTLGKNGQSDVGLAKQASRPSWVRQHTGRCTSLKALLKDVQERIRLCSSPTHSSSLYQEHNSPSHSLGKQLSILQGSAQSHSSRSGP